MNESGCFPKALPANCLAQMGKKANDRKKVKSENQCCIFRKYRWRKS